MVSLTPPQLHTTRIQSTTRLSLKSLDTTGIRLTEGFNRQKDWCALLTKCFCLQHSGSLWLFCEPSEIIVVIILLVAGGQCHSSCYLHLQATLLWTSLRLNLGHELRAHPYHCAFMSRHQSVKHYLQEMLHLTAILYYLSSQLDLIGLFKSYPLRQMFTFISVFSPLSQGTKLGKTERFLLKMNPCKICGIWQVCLYCC